MIKNFCLLALLFYTPFILYGQNEKIIIYTDDTPHLMPFIEKTLRSLKNQQEEPIFSKVTNLTRVLENEKDEQIQDEIRTTLRGGKGTTYNISAESKKLFESTLASNDYFLKTNILVVNELIEYQFTLYRIIKAHIEQNANEYIFRITNDFEEPERNVNIFINPKDKDYLTTLENTLKQLFPSSNTLPTPKLYVNGSFVDKATYCTVKDTLIFDASFSFDKQTSRENLKYTWIQIPSNGEKVIPDKQVLSLNQNQTTQTITFPEKGNYRVGVSVSDGIGNSQVLYIDVFVIESSIVFIPIKDIELFEFRPKRSRSKPLDFQLDLRVMQYLNKDLYYLKNYQAFQVTTQRISKTALGKSYSQISKIVKKEKGVTLEKMLHPEVLTFDTLITKSGFTLKMHLDPFDTWKDKKYTFKVQVIDHGVKSNVEVFRVRYTAFTWSFQVKKIGISQINAPTGEYEAYNDINILESITEVSTGDNTKSPPKKIISQSYSSPYLVGFSRFITNHIDLGIGFLPKRLRIKERISLPQIKTASLGDTTIFIRYEQMWNTFVSPYLEIGYNIMLPTQKERMFKIYKSQYGGKTPTFFRLSLTTFFLEPFYIGIVSLKGSSYPYSSAILEVYEPLIKQKSDDFIKIKYKPLFILGADLNMRILRKPTIHLSLGFGLSYFNKNFGVVGNAGLRYDLI